MSIIRFENVTKLYRRSHLGRIKESVGISEINVEIAKGEAFGLLGLNGSGKTTAIKLLLGLLYPTKGRVEVMGKTMPDLTALQRIGYLPEAAYINKYLTGREAVSIFARLSGIPSLKMNLTVESILDKVGMKNAANKRISDYSKGMVQRISIAQSLLHDPDILVLDEPITGLDPLAIREIRELVLWLKNQGKTIVLSSHSISEVEKICDRIGILVGGRLEKIINSKEWIGREGFLEKTFTDAVAGSGAVGALRFGEAG